MTIVLGPGWPGVLLHEAVGHGLEGDFNRKGSSAYAGMIGQRVAAKGVTVVKLAEAKSEISAQKGDRPGDELRAGVTPKSPFGLFYTR